MTTRSPAPTCRDNVIAGKGDDVVNGLGGMDYLQGDKGDETVNGGDNNDWVMGKEGSDIVIGGPGSDVVDDNINEPVNDTLEGDEATTIRRPSEGDDTPRGPGGRQDVRGSATTP